jgi:hypothetical protein
MCGAGAQNIVIGTGVHSATLSAVSLRPKFSGFGRGGVAYPQGRQHGCTRVLTTFTSILCVSKAHGMILQSRTGVETMTHVTTSASPDAGFHLQSSAPSPVFQPRAFDTIKLRRRFSDQFTTQGK